MTHDRRPLYVLLAGIVGLLAGPALLGLIRRELLWLGLAEAPALVSPFSFVLFELIVVTVAMFCMGLAVYPEKK